MQQMPDLGALELTALARRRPEIPVDSWWFGSHLRARVARIRRYGVSDDDRFYTMEGAVASGQAHPVSAHWRNLSSDGRGVLVGEQHQ